MRKLIFTLASVCLLLLISPSLSAFAAEGDTPPNNVTITVVMPDPTPPPAKEPSAPAIANIYPIGVTETRENGGRQIVKTYELGANENPADIPRGDFERGGWNYVLTDIIRKETASADTREHKEIVTANTDTKELETILSLLAQTMEYKAEDGFVGILSLDVASIKVETAGTKTSSYEMKVTREYPHLSTNDTSLVPKTATDNGKTYTLAGVEWKAGNYSTVDYEQIPDYYTAIATFTATGSSTKVTGYVTTAEYVGTLAKLTQGKTIYTAYFEGTEIRTPLEITEPSAAASAVDTTPAETSEAAEQSTETPTDEPTATPQSDASVETKGGSAAWLVIFPIIGATAGGAYYILKKRKGLKPNEKTHNPAVGIDDDSDDGDSGSRG
jgi:hypothetical protein